jgi:Flp pilus assembly protein TadG
MLARFRQLLRWRGDERGSPAVEFALIAPPTLLLLAGTVEFGTITFIQMLMEGGLREASRFGITGQDSPVAGVNREQYIVDVIEEHTLGLLTLGTDDVTIKSYRSFANLGGEKFTDGNGNGTYDTGETYTDCNKDGSYTPDLGVAGAGDSQDVVVYTIDHDWPLMTPIVADVIGDDDGTFHFHASVIVQNEPWDSADPGGERSECEP